MQKPIGSGPFKFVEYKSGQSVTLERNEDFFGGAPEIERLIYQIMPDLNTTLEAFKNGEIDYITSLPTANLHDFDNDPNYEVFSFLSCLLYTSTAHLWIHWKNAKSSKLRANRRPRSTLARAATLPRGVIRLARSVLKNIRKPVIWATDILFPVILSATTLKNKQRFRLCLLYTSRCV